MTHALARPLFNAIELQLHPESECKRKDDARAVAREWEDHR
jgi:hypothetical protein